MLNVTLDVDAFVLHIESFESLVCYFVTLCPSRCKKNKIRRHNERQYCTISGKLMGLVPQAKTKGAVDRKRRRQSHLQKNNGYFGNNNDAN